jgi:hypothetical protein
MRKLGVAIAVLAIGAIAVAPSVAQAPSTSVVVEAKVSPNKAGTPGNPQGVTLSGSVKWSSEEGVEPPIITKFDILIAKGGVYNGGKYPKCSQAVANRSGPSACPAKSIMGSATGAAYADNVITRPKVTLINGGANDICAYTVLQNPARVQTCVPMKIKKLSGDPKWGYRVTATVPENLQFVAGVPIALRDLKFTAGGKPWAKDYIATTNCPKNKKWGFQVTTFYLYEDDSTGSSEFADSVACR